MNRQDVKLPPINSREGHRLPNDNDLLIDEDGPKHRVTINTHNQNLKIWQKKTASCGHQLKRFDKKNFQTAIDQKYVPLNAFNQKDKKLIESAMEVIQTRKKNKDLAGKNQTIVQILQQKKEMFLVTMTHGIIQKQIGNLTNQAEERAKALLESNQILDRDRQDYEQFFEKYKAETKKIEEQNQKQLQKRLAKEQEIKARQITVNSLRTLKVRNEEAIASSLRYKNFLNQLPPKEWIEEQERKKQKRLKEVKDRLRTQWQMSSSSLSKASNTSSTSKFDQYFTSLVENGENQQIEQIINDQEMYFKQPSELIQFFNTLEESNLFNIQNSHIAEQKYQELKVQSQQRKKELVGIYQSHNQQKRQLEKQVSQLDNQIRLLKKKKQQHGLLDEKDNKDIKATIAQEYDSLSSELGAHNNYLPQLQSKTSASLTLLSAIQICMERLWEKVREFYGENGKQIKQIRTQLQKRKNNQKRQQAAKNNKLEEQKRKNRNNDKKEPTLKVTGRLDMKRSPPQERQVVKKVETSKKDIDDDQKYLME